MAIQWYKEFDVIVIGSGAAGFTAAITAKKQGLSTLLIEKTDKYGGSTALSGGAIWVPNNIYLQQAGLEDSVASAQTYLDATVGNSSSRKVQEAYLTRGPEMVKYFKINTHMHWEYVKGYSDYYPNKPGGKPEGRSIEAKIFNLKRLKKSLPTMRRSQIPTMGMVIKSMEFYKLNMFTRTLAGFLTAMKVGFRFVRTICSFGFYKPATLGEALIGRLMLSYKELNGELWLSTPFREIVSDSQGRVIGIIVEKDGRLLNLKARKGVIFGSGGFSHNQQLREQYLPKPTNAKWTLASEGQTGDLIPEAIKLGAALKVMDKVWGTPTGIPPSAPAYMAVADRALPGIIVVDQNGKRYVNECAPYHEFVDTMYEHNVHKGESLTIPSWYIFDKRVKSRYLVFGIMPGLSIPKTWKEAGFVKEALSIEELAAKISVPSHDLIDTIERYNGFAISGQDMDFGKGENPYDNFYGDPTRKNPNMAPIDKAPYYAIPIYPGDIGTKGGVKIDEYGRVLTSEHKVIEGLYAAGNASASIMGNTYPGPGATIGPAMVFGYVAAKHIADSKK